MFPMEYRAYQKDKHMICPVDSINFLGQYASLREKPHVTNQRDLKDILLMPFTGCYDKNGTKIFLWDIVRIYDDEVGYIYLSVEYKDGYFYLSQHEIYSYTDPMADSLPDVEVCGTKFTHADLLGLNALWDHHIVDSNTMIQKN